MNLRSVSDTAQLPSEDKTLSSFPFFLLTDLFPSTTSILGCLRQSDNIVKNEKASKSSDQYSGCFKFGPFYTFSS